MIFIRFGFIGAGKVGFSFGRYLRENNVEVSGYYSRTTASAMEAADFTKTKYFVHLSELVEKSDAICISTPDKEIIKVWNELKKLPVKNKLICHFSGCLSSEIFSDISKYGAYAYSIHPMFALSDKYNSYKHFKEAFITVEGDETHMEDVINIIRTLGNDYKVINRECKVLYHMASVVSSNLVLGLINCGVKYLRLSGFNEEEAVKALYPLIINNVENIKAQGVIESLTGPVERGDINTVLKHLQYIPQEDKELYRICSRKLIDIASVKNADRDYTSIKEVLEEEENEKYRSDI